MVIRLTFTHVMYHHIVLLSDLSYQIGIIGLMEYRERLQIAEWLTSSKNSLDDPRDSGERNPMEDSESPREVPNKDVTSNNSGGAAALKDDDDELDRWAQFLAFKKWVFTIGDADCSPSVPHGHLHHKNNPHPKLNPYTGRVFGKGQKEDVSLRLTRAEMKSLWNDSEFVAHCREQVIYYSSFAPAYDFPNARHGRLHFPRWR
ncbi:hypothetical protein [Duganella sp. Root198D2]|uniref:hypothetical protein n=1 Tax=Duganella sp. Root198D2 TaxID=1736489 RepID=UPI0012E36863|nr:hypothetical protein [Duganella sp. Root198D2]